MVSLRLITTGLEDVHSVVGYQLLVPTTLGEVNGYTVRDAVIQPKDGTSYSYEAMHDINKLSIPYLREYGEDRESSIAYMFASIFEQTILVWYKPFIAKFIKSVEQEFNLDVREEEFVDLYSLAKQKGLNSPSYKLADVYEYTKTDNLFELYDYLNNLPDPVRRSRV